jgi:hypothetical protein
VNLGTIIITWNGNQLYPAFPFQSIR